MQTNHHPHHYISALCCEIISCTFCDCDFSRQIGAGMEMLMEFFGGGRGGMKWVREAVGGGGGGGRSQWWGGFTF